MKYWKRVLWGAAAGLCLIAALLLIRGDQKTIAALTPQLAAASWETADKPYAMASVYLPESEAIAQSAVGEICLSVEKALTDSGVGSDTHPWLFAASYQTEKTLTCDGGSSEVLLTAVSGDYFQIHPMEVRSGWYMSEDDVMHDRVVLNRQAAWELFASDRVEGMLLMLDGAYYQVAAVVETERGKFNEMAAEDVPRAWVYADSPALMRMEIPSEPEGTAAGEMVSAPVSSPNDPGFTCVEMVLPQPVKDFAVSTMKNALKGSVSEQTEITDNSGRFSLGHRWEVLKTLSVRGISEGGVEYPYYENAARLTENHLAIRLVPEGLLLLVPMLSLLILLLMLNRKRTWGLHSIRDAVENAIDRKHRRDYDARMGITREPEEEDALSYADDWEEPEDVFGEDDEDEPDEYEDSEDFSDYDTYDTEEAYGEGELLTEDDEPEWTAPPKSKKERRRERKIRRRRAKRRQKERRRNANRR